MKEILEELVIKLQAVLTKKEEELSSQQDYNAYSIGHINNRRIEIESFSKSIKKVSNDPSLKKEILNNFTIEANRIIIEISMIKN